MLQAACTAPSTRGRPVEILRDRAGILFDMAMGSVPPTPDYVDLANLIANCDLEGLDEILDENREREHPADKQLIALHVRAARALREDLRTYGIVDEQVVPVLMAAVDLLDRRLYWMENGVWKRSDQAIQTWRNILKARAEVAHA